MSLLQEKTQEQQALEDKTPTDDLIALYFAGLETSLNKVRSLLAKDLSVKGKKGVLIDKYQQELSRLTEVYLDHIDGSTKHSVYLEIRKEDLKKCFASMSSTKK